MNISTLSTEEVVDTQFVDPRFLTPSEMLNYDGDAFTHQVATLKLEVLANQGDPNVVPRVYSRISAENSAEYDLEVMRRITSILGTYFSYPSLEPELYAILDTAFDVASYEDAIPEQLAWVNRYKVTWMAIKRELEI